MQLYQIKPIHKQKNRKRVGRGGKKGTYSGRGLKGQNSRAGRKFQPAIRELIKRYPKLRGYRFSAQEQETRIINLGDLEKNFQEKEAVTPRTLIEKRLVRKIKGRIPLIKILAGGEVKKGLVFEGCQVSKKAEEKIKKAGGKIKEHVVSKNNPNL